MASGAALARRRHHARQGRRCDPPRAAAGDLFGDHHGSGHAARDARQRARLARQISRCDASRRFVRCARGGNRCCGGDERNRMRRGIDLPRWSRSRASRTAWYSAVIKAFLFSSIACLWCVCAFAQTTTPAQPQTPQPTTTSNLPLGISTASSWKFERVGDHLQLIDQAAIEGPNLKFFADDVDLYEGTNRVVASGNVVFTNADGRISAERVEFNTATGIGTFYDASGIMSLGAAGASSAAAFGGQEPDVYFYGAMLEKIGLRK